MTLDWNTIKTRAAQFSAKYAKTHNERAEAQSFWNDFFDVFGIERRRVAAYEAKVAKLNKKSSGFADLFWPGVLLVEHKSAGESLEIAHEQALDYFVNLKEGEHPRYIVACDFQHFWLKDLDEGVEQRFTLKQLSANVSLFGFLRGQQTSRVSAQDPVNDRAVKQLSRLHDALRRDGYAGHWLQLLLVRLLFCLFADRTGLFEPAGKFADLIENGSRADGSDLGPMLRQLFDELDTEFEKRQKSVPGWLKDYPYVNGRLFEEKIRTPSFNGVMRDLLLDCCNTDWSKISPAIFGSMFQRVIDLEGVDDDKDLRRELGAHYTSEENILKLIKPLFLDELWAEFDKCKNNRNKLFEFHKKLRRLTFFDPACGCGNFLVITYRELRILELEILRSVRNDSRLMNLLDFHSYLTIDVDQFYGIEIEEFPAQIAQVAMWLVDHQMNVRVSDEFGLYFARIPLKTSPHIVHDNALRVDWNEVLPAEICCYVLGNPPFVGKKEQSATQKADVEPLFGLLKGGGILDYVAAWYVKAAGYSKANISIRCAFVSTNSITQGEQVGVLWGWLLAQSAHIHFAHRTFRWSNEASGKAAVHCVIVGFGLGDIQNKVIYDYDDIAGEPLAVNAKFVNHYLIDAPNVILGKRTVPICRVPEINYGSMANDNGHLILSREEYQAFIAFAPQASHLLRRYVGGHEFLNNEERWCFWLKDISPGELRRFPQLMERIDAVKRFRLASNRKETRALAVMPSLFGEIRQPCTDYLLIPKVSSESRPLMPIGFIQSRTIANGSALIIPDARKYEFGVLSSTMHMAWMRTTAGRMKSDYQYSAGIVYNNFPWPESPTDAQKQAIEAAAQGVLDARATHPGSSLADLYDPLTMPPDLVRAHQKLDAAVDAAYAKSSGRKSFKNDAERIAFLFELYQKYTSFLPVESSKPKRARKIKSSA